MYTKQEIIIRSHREGKSQRHIARELQISRKTVRKYLAEYESERLRYTDLKEAQINYLSSPPTYKCANRNKIKLTREVQAEIDKLIEENRLKLVQGLTKQLLKKCDILSILHEKGYEIGYTTVCNYVTGKERGKIQREAFIRQHYKPGTECEFDWGEIKLWIAGRLCSLYMAVFTSAYSNYRYAQIYQRQDTLSFMEAHVSFFKHVQGIYHKMVYDNMRVAVARFVGKYEKEPTRALVDLKSHYQFTHRFCNAYRANEKGHVEKSVEYVRRKAFGHFNNFKDIRSASEHLATCLNKLNNTIQQLTSKTACELFEEEKTVLWKVPEPLSCSELMQLRVDKYSTVSFRCNRYSLPDSLVGEFVTASIFSNKIEFYHNNNKITTHTRSYGHHQWIINIEHYLDTLRKKPGALAGSVALACNNYLKNIYECYFEDSPRDFIELLHYCKNNSISNEKLEENIQRLLLFGSKNVTTEKLTALLGNHNSSCLSAKVINIQNETTLKSKQQLIELAGLF